MRLGHKARLIGFGFVHSGASAEMETQGALLQVCAGSG